MTGPRLHGFWAALLAVGGLAVSLPAVADASFPGRNGRILVSRGEPHGNSTLWAVSVRSGRAKRLTKLPRRCRGKRDQWWDLDGSYSASGRSIVYSHVDNCDRRLRSGIYVMTAEGKQRRLLVSERPGWELNWPAFSPDDKTIAFDRDWNMRGGDPQDELTYRSAIYQVARDRPGKPVRVDPGAEPYEWSPGWSVTNRLAVASLRDVFFLIYATNITTIEPPFPGSGAPDRKRLTFADAYDGEPDWSPDSTRIAFQRESLFEDRSDVRVIGANGTGPKRLTRSRHAWDPVWSPDGSSIAYILRRRPRGPGVLYVMRANGSHKHRIASRIEEQRLSWQPLPRQQ